MTIKETIQNDLKTAMKARDSQRVAILRFLSAAVKQKEVDDRVELTDADILAILDKQAKQRRESIEQYKQAGRDELAQKEQQELDVIQSYLPQPLTDEEVAALIDSAIQATGAQGMQDMGKVMGMLKPKIQGRADMKAVSQLVRDKLNA